MVLTVMERLLLLNLLPLEGDITTLRIVRALREDLSFSEQEHADLKFQVGEGKVTWDTAHELVKDVPIGAKASRLIEETLTKLSLEKKLGAQHVDLYEKFVKIGD